MAIDSGTIAKSGDGSTAPSGGLDGAYLEQVGASKHFVIGGVMPEKETLERVRKTHVKARHQALRPANSYAKRFITYEKVSMEYATQNRQLPSACPKPERPA